MDSKLKIFICIILLFSSCTKSRQITEILTSVDSLVYYHPDSAELILDKLAGIELSEKQEADYWRLLTTSHVLQRKSTVEDSMIFSTLNYLKKHDEMDKHRINIYSLVFNHLLWKDDTAKYNKYINEATELAIQENDSVFAHIVYQQVAHDYNGKNDYETAYRYYVKASEYNSVSWTYYMAALAYSRNKNNDTLDYWMQKAINLAIEKKDTASIHHYYRNYADILIGHKDYNKALENIRNMERYDTDSFSVTPKMMADIFMQQHQLDSAQFYLDKMLDQDFGDIENKRSFGFTVKGISLFKGFVEYAKGGDYDFSKIGRFTDSIQGDQLSKMRKFEEQVMVKQKLTAQNQDLIIKKQRLQLMLLFISLVVSIVAVLIYLYIKKKKDRLIQMEEKMESIQKLMSDVSIDLKESRENSSYFKKVLLQQLGLIRFAASNPTSENQELLQRIAKITNNEIPVDSLIIWEDLYALIDSLYDNFYTKMKKAYGAVLNEKEMQLCCLLCVNFGTKEISVITQQSVRTIYQRKTLIREKLKMQQGEDLVDFIGAVNGVS